MFFGHFLSNNTQVVIEPSREFEGQYKLQRDQALARLQNMSLNIHYMYIFEYIYLFIDIEVMLLDHWITQ